MSAPRPRITRLDTIDSTSTEARRRVRLGADVDGLVLVADEQTDGHGRRGSSWVMLPGRSLAFTMVRPRPAGVRAATLMARLAVAACRGLEAAGAPALQIKWPNDVLRDAAKAGGLLVEVVGDPDGRDWLLLGLGVNLWLRDLPADARPADLPRHAGDAGLAPGPGADELALRHLLREFDAALAELATPADAERAREYVARSWIIDRQVTVEYRGQRHETRVAAVSEDGDLTTAEGLRLQAEHVHLAHVEGLR